MTIPKTYRFTLTPEEYDVIIDALTTARMPWKVTNPVIQKINNQRLDQNRMFQEQLAIEQKKAEEKRKEIEEKRKEADKKRAKGTVEVEGKVEK